MESKNIILREAKFSDCQLFANWEVENSVTEFFTVDEGLTYEDVVTDFVRSKTDDTKKIYTIVSKALDKPIGKLYITRINPICDSLDITRIYIGDVNERGKGYGEESLRLFLEYAFINLHMERVTLDYMIRNKVGESLSEKIGFQREGIRRNAGKKNGKYVDLNSMSMLRAEYYEKLHK